MITPIYIGRLSTHHENKVWGVVVRACLDVNQPFFHGLNQKGCSGMNFKFAHKACAVAIYSFWAYAKAFCNLIVGITPRNTLEHFYFAVGQFFGLVREFKQFGYVFGNNLFAGHHFLYAIADFGRRRVFHKNSVDTGINELSKQGRRGHSGNDNIAGFRRPSLCFGKNLHTVGSGHRKIKNCTIGLAKFNFSNCIDAIIRLANNFYIGTRRYNPGKAIRGQRMVICNKYGFGHINPLSFTKASQIAPMRFACRMSLYLLFIFQTTGSFAEPLIVPLDGPKRSTELQPYISYYLDTGWERTVSEMLNEYADKFKPIETTNPDFGYTKSKIWLRMKFRNESSLEEDWRIHFKENFKQLFDVYVARENFSIETVLSQDLERGFYSRSIPYPELVAPLLIEPGEEVTVLVNYWSEGASYLQLSMETAPSFTDIAAKRTAKNFIYYGMMMLLIVAALICLIIYQHVVFAAYIAYAGSTLLYLMHSDGVAYQYLWPEFPKFNSIASIVTGSGIIVFACVYARVFLVTKKRHPWVDKLLLAVIITTLALDVSAFVFDNQIIKKILVFVSLVAVLSCTLSGVVAARTRFKEVRFFLLAWLGILLASGIMNLRHLLGIEISQDFQFDFMRIVMVVDAAMMGLAIADRYNQHRAARQKATKESLQEAKRNLDLTKRLGELEKQYVFAEEAALNKDEQIANTIHDLRQPLHALRMNVSHLIDGKGEVSVMPGEVEQTFEYLEDLVSSHLGHSGYGHSEVNNYKQAEDDGLSTNQVLRSVYEMFLPDAKAKKLEFDFVPTSNSAEIEPLVLMRIVTNLVSNAIKYTENGKILLGVRKRNGSLCVEVHDTGPGMSGETFEVAKQREMRLEIEESRQEGNGYGLSIVHELADKHGCRLYVRTDRKSGTGVVVELPAA